MTVFDIAVCIFTLLLVCSFCWVNNAMKKRNFFFLKGQSLKQYVRNPHTHMQNKCSFGAGQQELKAYENKKYRRRDHREVWYMDCISCQSVQLYELHIVGSISCFKETAPGCAWSLLPSAVFGSERFLANPFGNKHEGYLNSNGPAQELSFWLATKTCWSNIILYSQHCTYVYCNVYKGILRG